MCANFSVYLLPTKQLIHPVYAYTMSYIVSDIANDHWTNVISLFVRGVVNYSKICIWKSYQAITHMHTPTHTHTYSCKHLRLNCNCPSVFISYTTYASPQLLCATNLLPTCKYRIVELFGDDSRVISANISLRRISLRRVCNGLSKMPTKYLL